MSTEENKAILRRWFDETWNKGDMEVTDELTAPDFALHAAGPVPIDSRDAFKGTVALWFSAFPGGRMTIDQLFAEGDKVVARWTASGTHQGDFFGIPPTGKQVTWTGITIYRLADGKVVEAWGETDILGLMQQLGVGAQG